MSPFAAPVLSIALIASAPLTPTPVLDLGDVADRVEDAVGDRGGDVRDAVEDAIGDRGDEIRDAVNDAAAGDYDGAKALAREADAELKARTGRSSAEWAEELSPELYALASAQLTTTSTQATNLIVAAIRDGRDVCSALRTGAYRVDCIGERLEQVSRALPRSGDYRAARTILSKAGKDLAKLARRNRSRDLPRGRVKVAGGTSSRPLTPVDPAKQAAVDRAARAILVEAETKLLRAHQSSDKRQLEFRRIAAAVDSTKVLLRST